MGVELLIKPGRSGFVGSDAHEIGLCLPRQRPFFLAIVNGARVRSPSPMHLSTILSTVPKTQEYEFDLVTRTIGLIIRGPLLEPPPPPELLCMASQCGSILKLRLWT